MPVKFMYVTIYCITSNFAAIGNTNTTGAVSTHCHFTGTAGTMTIGILVILIWCWISVIVYEIIAGIGILSEHEHNIITCM